MESFRIRILRKSGKVSGIPIIFHREGAETLRTGDKFLSMLCAMR
jgi:hypothetical protein